MFFALHKNYSSTTQKTGMFSKALFRHLYSWWKTMLLRDIHTPSGQYIHSWTIFFQSIHLQETIHKAIHESSIYFLLKPCFNSVRLGNPRQRHEVNCLRIRVRRSRGSLPRKLIDWKVSAGYQLWDIVRSFHVSSQEGMNIPWCSRPAMESKQLQIA